MTTKKEFKFFSIFHYEEEEKYLSEMHAKGWKFVKLTGIGMYHFEACEPEEVVYQLDYNQEKNKDKGAYVQMFADCGWEYMFDWAQYSYFRKPKSQMQGEEAIFGDDQSRYDMMERVYKGRLIPLLVIFLAVILPQCILNLTIYHSYVVGIVYAFIVVVYCNIFVVCLKKKKEFGERLK